MRTTKLEKEMTLTKKIAANVALVALCAPVMMVFNTNADAYYINIIGIAYCWLMAKAHRRILPRWLVDYIHRIPV